MTARNETLLCERIKHCRKCGKCTICSCSCKCECIGWKCGWCGDCINCTCYVKNGENRICVTHKKGYAGWVNSVEPYCTKCGTKVPSECLCCNCICLYCCGCGQCLMCGNCTCGHEDKDYKLKSHLCPACDKLKYGRSRYLMCKESPETGVYSKCTDSRNLCNMGNLIVETIRARSAEISLKETRIREIVAKSDKGE